MIFYELLKFISNSPSRGRNIWWLPSVEIRRKQGPARIWGAGLCYSFIRGSWKDDCIVAGGCGFFAVYSELFHDIGFAFVDDFEFEIVWLAVAVGE